MKVRKRDGRIEDFKTENIKRTIRYAAQAVENEEADFKEHKEEYESLVNSMLEAGYNLEEARGIAEDQIGGYVLNGMYTEFDQDEADEVVDMVVDVLNELGDNIIDVDIIQDAIEKALITTDHTKTAREYISRRTQRDKVREMNSNLMKCFEGLTFKNSIDNDTKRENANIDGDSAMGTMLKYGSESAKEFNLLHLVSPDIADAHRNGDIHIHDLDFMALTQTCLVGDTLITIKRGDRAPVTVEAQWFDMYLDKYDDDTIVNLEGLKILSKGQFVDLKNCVRHSSNDKRVLKISTQSTDISVTSDHVIPVIRDGKTVDLHADEIVLGDILLRDYTDEFGGLHSINLIDQFRNKGNIIIYNSDYVIECIKSAGLWKEFCSRVGYDVHGNQIRYCKSKLTLEDYLLYVRDLRCVDERELKLAYKRTRGTQTIDAILPLTKELGKFMGYMFSEGSVGEYECSHQDSYEKKACFVNQDERIINDFNKCIKTVFNDAAIKDRYTYGIHNGTHLSGYIAWELFHGPFGVKNHSSDMRLPEWIYSANKDFLNGFYSALIDGDGCVQKDGLRLLYTSVCKEFILQLQRLLNLNGISSRIQVSHTAGTLAKFGEVESIRNFDTYKLEVVKDCHKLKWLDSFKIKNTYLREESVDSDIYYKVTSIEEVEYSGYVYDFETENHYFSANGITVHNCCQIDLLKLFKGGFNTGHGFLREPQDIRTAGALACIAIQSNQNDQHRRTV